MPEGCKGSYQISEIITTVKEYRDKFEILTPDLSANPLRQGVLRDLDIALVRLKSAETGLKFMNEIVARVKGMPMHVPEGKYPADEVEGR
jgi:hypothetical protein